MPLELWAYTAEKRMTPPAYHRRNKGRLTALRRYATLVAAVADTVAQPGAGRGKSNPPRTGASGPNRLTSSSGPVLKAWTLRLPPHRRDPVAPRARHSAKVLNYNPAPQNNSRFNLRAARTIHPAAHKM